MPNIDALNIGFRHPSNVLSLIDMWLQSVYLSQMFPALKRASTAKRLYVNKVKRPLSLKIDRLN